MFQFNSGLENMFQLIRDNPGLLRLEIDFVFHF
jgi:hypothetical protein